MQQTGVSGFTKGVKTSFHLAMLAVFQHLQRFIEENPLSFERVNTMFPAPLREIPLSYSRPVIRAYSIIVL